MTSKPSFSQTSSFFVEECDGGGVRIRIIDASGRLLAQASGPDKETATRLALRQVILGTPASMAAEPADVGAATVSAGSI